MCLIIYGDRSITSSVRWGRSLPLGRRVESKKQNMSLPTYLWVLRCVSPRSGVPRRTLSPLTPESSGNVRSGSPGFRTVSAPSPSPSSLTHDLGIPSCPSPTESGTRGPDRVDWGTKQSEGERGGRGRDIRIVTPTSRGWSDVLLVQGHNYPLYNLSCDKVPK